MTEFPKVKAGDHVRVVIEAEVIYVAEHGTFDTEEFYFSPDYDEIKSVEVLEPEWQEGDVVLSSDGLPHIREGGAWRTFSGSLWGDHWPRRPLTLIARHGKPVK